MSSDNQNLTDTLLTSIVAQHIKSKHGETF